MRVLRTTIALVLLVLWAPVTTHCSWEDLAGGMFQCASDTAQETDCANDGDNCAAVESGSYKVSDAAPDVPAPIFALVLFHLPAFVPPPPAQAVAQTAAPSEIAVSWRFISRVALPPRAPSLS